MTPQSCKKWIIIITSAAIAITRMKIWNKTGPLIFATTQKMTHGKEKQEINVVIILFMEKPDNQPH